MPSPVATASASPGPGLVIGPLAAGTYHVTEMSPAFTITVPAGFTLRVHTSDTFYVTTGPSANAPEFAVILPFGHYGVIKALEGSSTFKVSAPVAVKVGGLDGRAIDLELPKLSSKATPAPDWQLALFQRASDGELWFVEPDRKIHLIELTAGDGTVVITYDASTAEYAAFEQLVEPMIASIVF